MERDGCKNGFTLIELLIVIAIILTLLAVAMPNFFRAREAANEASAVSSCRAIITSEVTFSDYYQQGYTSTLAQLGPPVSGPPSVTNADLIDSVLASGSKSGYQFVYTPTALQGTAYSSYGVNANPSDLGVTGTRYFFADQSGVIRFSAAAVATASDSPLD